MRIKHWTIVVLGVIWAGYLSGGDGLGLSRALGAGPKTAPVNKPTYMTAETQGALFYAVSADGRKLAYTATRDGFVDLWLTADEPGKINLPERLTHDPAAESFPAFSPTGDLLAYTGTAHDVKGDIFLLSLKRKSEPRRLTGRETADSAPCFSADGKRLYFHRSKPGDRTRQIVYLELDRLQAEPTPVNIDGDAAFPALSPDGKLMAFISTRHHEGGDLFVLSLADGRLRALTQDPMIDASPAWSPDGKSLIFTRYPSRNQAIEKSPISPDRAALYRIRVFPEQDAGQSAFERLHPLTSFGYQAFFPQIARNSLFFISDTDGAANILSLPLEGEIPIQPTVEAQLAAALELNAKIPYDPYQSLLGFHKVLEIFPEAPAAGARAAFEIGKLYHYRLQLFAPALEAYQFIQTAAAGHSAGLLSPWDGYAHIDEHVIQIKRQLAGQPMPSAQASILNAGIARLDEIAQAVTMPEVSARARIEQARLRITLGKTAQDLTLALDLLDQVIAQSQVAERELAAEASLLKAEIFIRAGQAQKSLPVLRETAKNYADIPEWADQAARQIIDLAISDAVGATLDDKIRLMRALEEENRKEIPTLAAGALNRIGDLYFADRNSAQAKDAYRQVLTWYAAQPTLSAAARLSLAEIYFREERFRKALDLYETEIAARPYEDQIYHLARNGYIRKSLAAGEFLYRVGEVASAAKTFKELIDYDPAIVEAHRGYIKCTAAMKKIRPLLAAYRKQMADAPQDSIPVYATALSLTYLEDQPSLLEARNLLHKAIAANGRIEYFYQTLGYVCEVLETVHQSPGMLELALEAYRKAYFLNDRQKNPDNAANLMLNVGNVYFLLQRYEQAFLYYQKRLAADVPFEQSNTEIIFYQRLGISAAHAYETRQAIEAYSQALERIEVRIDPRQAASSFDNLARFILDRVISPGLTQPAVEPQARTLAKRQSDLNRRLAELNRPEVFPPPAKTWPPYQAAIMALLSEQKKLFPEVLNLAGKLNLPEFPAQEVADRLSLLALKVEQDLAFPTRLTQLKAELHDRIGLAHQEIAAWESAIRHFETVFRLNQALGLNRNLVRNKRSIAYNHYMLAGTYAGENKREQLRIAAQAFAETMELAKTLGVPEPKAARSSGSLVSLEIYQSLDEVSATQFAHGFTVEQEIRVAETFLARIQLELGNLHPAEASLDAQLQPYQKGFPNAIPDKDLYGVSLVYHRAAHIKAALGKFTEAFALFRQSAELSLKMKNTISATLNVSNMAAVLFHLEQAAPDLNSQPLRDQLLALDRNMADLIAESSFIGIASVAAAYHNRMGVYLFPDPDGQPSSFSPQPAGSASAARRMKRLEAAAVHFWNGVRLIEASGGIKDRTEASLLAALYLNLAHVAESLQDQAQADTCYQSALALADKGILLAVKWRALIGLKRHAQALDVLNEVTILEAGCAPGEITRGLSPLAASLVESGNIEDGFDLVEQLSELERFHRLAPLFGVVRPEAKALFIKLTPRFMRLFALRESLAESAESQRRILLDQIEVENRLLKDEIGEVWKALPEYHRYATDDLSRERILAILGLSSRLEEIAAAYFKSQSGDDLRRYETHLSRYRKFFRDAIKARPAEKPADVLTFFGPEPATTMDLMDVLPENEVLYRLFQLQDQRMIVFKLSADEITAEIHDSLEQAALIAMRTDYIAYDDPRFLFGAEAEFAALSGTHWYRSILNRNPFKRALLAIPPLEPAPLGFEALAHVDGAQFIAPANTLALFARLGLASTAPTREGELPEYFIALNPTGEARIRLDDVLMNPTALSLALLSGVSVNEVYVAGHLASIYGCPTLILPSQPAADTAFAANFLRAYADASAIESKRQAESACPADGCPEQWLILGYKGMTPAESREFAVKRFATFVKEAQREFQAGQYQRALSLFEQSLQISETSDQFKPYTSSLRIHARESAYRAGNLPQALVQARALVEYLAQTQPDTSEHAESLLMLGVLLAGMEKYDQAIAALEEAAEMTENLEDDPGRLKALVNLGIILENATDYDRALVRFQSAAEISDSLAKESVLAEQYENIGRIHDLRLNQFAAAIQYYAKALEIYENMEEAEAVGRLWLNMGRCRRLLGDFAQADQHYVEALKAVNTPSGRMRIIIEQANNAWFQGRYEEAFRFQRECHRLSVDLNDALFRVISLNTAGLIWWTLGDSRKALSELQQALEIAETLKVRDDEIATTLNNIGLVHRERGDYDQALVALDKALAIDTRLKSNWAIAYDLRNKALTLLKMNRPEEAKPLLEQAIAISRDIGDRVNEGKALLGLGQTCLTQKRPDEAEPAFKAALSLAIRLVDRETRWRALFGLAQIEILRQQKAAPGSAIQEKFSAEPLLREAIEVIEEMRADIRIDGLKEGFIDNKLTVYETLITLLADKGDISDAFEIAERSRGRSFIDMIGNQRISFTRDLDRELYERIDQIKNHIKAQENLVAQSESEAERNAYGQALNRLEAEYRDLMLEIQVRHPQLSAFVSVAPTTWESLKAFIEPNTILLSYFVAEQEILIWVVKSDQLELIRTPLSRKTLESAVLEYRRVLQNLEPAELFARQLYDWLIKPVWSKISPADQVGLIPHGPLHYLSFATLTDGELYLIEQLPLFYLPHAGLLKYTMGKRTDAKDLKILAIGNPDLGDDALDLPFAEHEVQSVKWNFNDITVLTRALARESWVVRHIHEFDIIYMASHGEFDPINPLFSALKLVKDDEADGNLETAEVFGLNIDADMVVLSACQTGLGKVTAGDEIIGLNRAFFYAGAHTIVSSLWRVSDISTAMLIKHFFRDYLRHHKAQSLQRAMLNVKNRYPHPGYWGAFVLSGDYY